VVDLEDIGGPIGASKVVWHALVVMTPTDRKLLLFQRSLPKKPPSSDCCGQQTEVPAKQQLPEMVTPVIRASLSKQGYKLIGSHSGVKLCRWTKAR
jgi:hypothetical protein